MNKAIQTGFEFNESTECRDANNFAFYDRADRILFSGIIPGLGSKLLETKLNAFTFAV